MKKTITYSDQQKEVINYSGSQLLIRGIAGSGKTLILLKKARDVAEKNPNETVAVFSYGNPLSDSAKRQLESYNLPNLTVKTFHSWAMRTYCLVFRKRKIYMTNRQVISDAIKEVSTIYPKHRFITNKDLKGFIEEEISWIKGSDLCQREKYMKEPRKGRGGKVRVTPEDREVIFKIYEEYEKIRDYRLDYDDLGLQLSRNLDKIPDEQKFDHVFIDEAQDLTKVNLMVLCGIARKSRIVGADKGQKIFTTSFTWEDVGLNIKGRRTKILRNSYRSTKQIMELAYSIQEKDEISKDEEFTRPDLPTAEGQKPKVIFSKDIESQHQALSEAIRIIQREDPDAVIGILSRNREHMNNVQKLLNRERIDYKFIQSSAKKGDQEKLGSHHEPGVKLTTLHTAKGLEFKYVFITDVVDPPTYERLGDDFDWDIERRLLYVGMSRAMKQLYLFTYGDRHNLIDELGKPFYEKVMI
ncbi:3'-5' exonuclease [Priestia koreensis]|uniref:DNA 3'-5' helicase n=1 Tax=Priestia koreensis TaxID=284581 RepID=A0A0M0KWU8_9BACI|nr:3'-5' exonuclease [Priestia koreensis]KOO43087.1 hypothetical protein AMD01_16190 [Priestia koreensis]